MNLGTEPPTLDWNLANDVNSFDVISNLMVGLTRFGSDADGNIISVPGCAESWTVNTDATEYIFKLDPRAQWTDGKRVTPQHFIDSFKRLLDPETAAPYADLLSMIDLEKTGAIDDQTLKIRLKHPAAYFIYLTSYGLTLPIRRDLIEKYGNDWTEPENLITNGPFKLKQWQHEYKIVLERNHDFHLQSKKKNLVEYLKFFMVPEQASAYTLYKNNQFDWIDSRSIPISEQKNLKDPHRVTLLRNTYIGFNHEKPPFNNKLVRQAFSYAINRDDIVKIRSRGDIANNTWIPQSLHNYLDFTQLPENYKNSNGYNPELARKKLSEAGYADGKNFPEVEFLIPSREDSKLLAETLQAIWTKELNITVKITAMEWKVFLATLRDKPTDLFRLNWGADYPDPDTFMQLFSSSNQINYGRWSNPRYDELVAKAAASTDLRLRKSLYTEAEKILTFEEMAIAPLFIGTQTILKKDQVQGLEVNAMDIVFLDKVELSGSL